MFIWTIVKVALKSLIANKLRSFLAMLGIIIGVSAVISLLSLGAGAQNEISKQVATMGKNILTVRPGTRNSGGVRSSFANTLKLEDAESILKEVKEVEMVSPTASNNYQIKYFNKNTFSSVNGVASTYFNIRNIKVEKGRLISSSESESNMRIAVLGSKVVEDLFGKGEPIDESIKINGINFKIIGTLEKKGDGGFSPDENIYIPYKVAMKQLIGTENPRSIEIKGFDDVDMLKVEEKITELLRKKHQLQENAPDDFMTFNMAEMIKQSESFTQIFTFLLGGIAGISLIVGGIGIMNIMLVTVTERTREIGIRKAIGAKERDILRQFLIESVVMTTLGGVIGILFGYGISKIISFFVPFPPIVTMTSIIISISFSTVVGIFFGYYPARRAAKLDPIEALRYE
ncbi:MAG: ABC transporter permease [Candidatus Sericytochromatia bacterium]